MCGYNSCPGVVRLLVKTATGHAEAALNPMINTVGTDPRPGPCIAVVPHGLVFPLGTWPQFK